MRLYKISLVFLLLASFVSAEQEDTVIKTVLVTDQISNDLKDSFDFDAITDQMIATGLDQEIEIKPPSKIVVWFSKLGMPFVIKLANLYQKCIEFWHHANDAK